MTITDELKFTDELKAAHCNGLVSGSSRSLTAVVDAILQDHGPVEATAALIAAACDLNLLPELKLKLQLARLDDTEKRVPL